MYIKMSRKESKKYGNPRRKRLPKGEYLQSCPKPNRDVTMERYNQNGNLIWKKYTHSIHPREWPCPCCEKTTLGTGDEKCPDICWICQLSVCKKCFGDDERCFMESWTTVCKKCLWTSIRWQGCHIRGKFKEGFERPVKWKNMDKHSWTSLKTFDIEKFKKRFAKRPVEWNTLIYC